MDSKRNEDEPVSSEEMERDGWRERGTLIRDEDASGHDVPESARDPTSSDRKKPMPDPTILPPD